VTYEVTAAVDPNCPVGNWTAEVYLKTSNRGVEKIRIPVTVNVTNPISVQTDATGVVLKSTEPFKVLGVKGADDSLVLQGPAAEAKEHRLAYKIAPNAKPGPAARTYEVTTDLKDQPKVQVELKSPVNR